MTATAVITDYEYPSIATEKEIITGAGFVLKDYQAKTQQELIDCTKDADAVIVQYANIDRAVIENMTRAKMIIKYGVGINNIDADAAAERGIYVCNVPDSALDEVSNQAIAMLLMLSRKMPQAMTALKEGKWGNAPFKPLFRLAGQTLGIVGFGTLGSLVARKMGNFGMTIIAHDPAVSREKAAALNVQLVSLEELCRRSDFVSLHCPHNKATEGMFNRKVFGWMKEGAYLVNTARGGVVVEEDLIEALRSGRLAGAGLDVFEKEPLDPASPLLAMPNVVATGHVAWYSENAIDILQRKVAQEVVNVLQGNKPFNPCNEPKKGEA